jgi:hypothetical protein
VNAYLVVDLQNSVKLMKFLAAKKAVFIDDRSISGKENDDRRSDEIASLAF